jgi:hypothetical protein
MFDSATLRARRLGGQTSDFIAATRKLTAVWRHGVRVALARAMSFANLIDRVRFDFTEMPNLELTVAQAVRLWNLGADDCRYVLDSLVDVGFLRWTPQRTVVRSGSRLGLGERSASYIPVRVSQYRNNVVG